MFKSTNNVVGKATINHEDGDLLAKDLPVEMPAESSTYLVFIYADIVVTIHLTKGEVVLARKTE